MKYLSRLQLLGGSLAVIGAFGVGGASAQDQVVLTMLTGNNPNTIAINDALIAAYTAKNPNVSFDIELGPAGSEADNLIKTRLATQQMQDIFAYNSGSLLQALSPAQTLVDLKDQPFMGQVQDSFKQAVAAGDQVFGVPMGAADAGGIFYNRKVYAEHGITVPKTWDEFMANNKKLKDAGVVPVAQTYGATWTSQIIVLADYYNVQAVEPDFAQRYTAGEAKFATTPATVRSFEKLAALHPAGDLNEDFAAATYEDGLRMVAEGSVASYPMLTYAIPVFSQTFPDQLNDLGFFALPGDNAEDNGLTVWMPTSYYIPQTTPEDKRAAALDFLAFVASPEGCDAISSAVTVNGPFLIAGCELPADVPPVVSDLLPYFAEGGKNAPALEFLSPVKGPMLEQLTVEVGSGIRPAAESAALYDQDVTRQAQQLGLPGW